MKKLFFLLFISCLLKAEGPFPVLKNGLLSFIDKNGKIVLESQSTRFDFNIFTQEKSELQIKQNGDILSEISSGRISTFSEGFARYQKGGWGIFKVHNWGFVKEDSTVAIEPEYASVDDFSEGLAAVEKQDRFLFFIFSSKFGFVNKTGKLIIPCIFDKVTKFSDGLAMVTVDNKKGYINTSGDIVISPKFYKADLFIDGFAPVLQDDQWGYINKKGQFVLKPQFDEAQRFYNGFASVKFNGKWGMINSDMVTVIPYNFDEVVVLNNNYAKVRIDRLWGLWDINSKNYILPCQYEHLIYCYYDLIRLIKDNKVGYTTLSGKTIWELQN